MGVVDHDARAGRYYLDRNARGRRHRRHGGPRRRRRDRLRDRARRTIGQPREASRVTGRDLPFLVLRVALVTAASMAPPPRVAERDAEVPTAPFTMRDDFQDDSLGQWASYPPAQDVGYEPSLTPTALLDARGGRSLMRVVRPTTAGPLR